MGWIGQFASVWKKQISYLENNESILKREENSSALDFYKKAEMILKFGL